MGVICRNASEGVKKFFRRVKRTSRLALPQSLERGDSARAIRGQATNLKTQNSSPVPELR